MLNFDAFEVLTFDCYGTLIDWENGILDALRPVLAGHGVEESDRTLLETYAQFESDIQDGAYLKYRHVLREVMRRFGQRYNFEPTEAELTRLEDSIQHWKPFSDTVEALGKLKSRYKLMVLSNIDNDLFAGSQKQLHVPFDNVMTAEQIGSYKPNLRNFEFAIAHIGLDKSKILHVAQSLFHDIAPAKQIGLATVWINRRQDQEGSGATKPTEATPDLEFPSLGALATAIGLDNR